MRWILGTLMIMLKPKEECDGMVVMPKQHNKCPKGGPGPYVCESESGRCKKHRIGDFKILNKRDPGAISIEDTDPIAYDVLIKCWF